MRVVHDENVRNCAVYESGMYKVLEFACNRYDGWRMAGLWRLDLVSERLRPVVSEVLARLNAGEADGFHLRSGRFTAWVSVPVYQVLE